MRAALLLTLCLTSILATAQNAPMGAVAGLGPGNSFTLFVTFKEPMPKIDALSCGFNLVGSPKPGQESFSKSVNCIGSVIKDDDTRYRAQVDIQNGGIADGDYKLTSIDIRIGGATRSYASKDLPDIAPVTITNDEHLKFSEIKHLEVKTN